MLYRAPIRVEDTEDIVEGPAQQACQPGAVGASRKLRSWARVAMVQRGGRDVQVACAAQALVHGSQVPCVATSLQVHILQLDTAQCQCLPKLLPPCTCVCLSSRLPQRMQGALQKAGACRQNHGIRG